MSRRSPLVLSEEEDTRDLAREGNWPTSTPPAARAATSVTSATTAGAPPVSQPTLARAMSHPTAAQRRRSAVAAGAARPDDGVQPMDETEGQTAASSIPASTTPSAGAAPSHATDMRETLKHAAAARAARANKALAASSAAAAPASSHAGAPPPAASSAAASSSALPMPTELEAFSYDAALPLDVSGDEELARLLQEQEATAAAADVDSTSSRPSTPLSRRGSVSPQRRLTEFRPLDPDFVSSGACLGIPRTTGDELAFFFNRVSGQAKRCTLRLNTIISGDVQRAVLFNYCIDMDWMVAACPQLLTFPRVDVVTVEDRSKGLQPPKRDPVYANMTYYTPPMPIQYGTHHSKMILLFYAHGVRVCIVTANFIAVDWVWKNNVSFVQDFPRKNEHSPKTSEFEHDLCDYMLAYKRSQLDIRTEIQQFDYSAAKCILIPSVPGYHQAATMHRYGHMKMRHVLSREAIPAKFAKAPIIAQFSSVGSITDNWLNGELRMSLGAQKSVADPPAAPAAAASAASVLMQSTSLPPLKLIWPTVRQVQSSLEGWSAGGSLCCDAKNMKPFMRHLLHVWDGLPQDRDRALPHIKTYTRAAPDGELAWVLMTSANLSNAAWGQLQKQGTQMQIRSYELGCLFTPTHYAKALQLLKARRQVNFTCTPAQPIIFSPQGDRSKLPYFAQEDASAGTPLPPAVRFLALPPVPVYAAMHPAVPKPTKRKASETIDIDLSPSPPLAAHKRAKHGKESTAAAASTPGATAESTVACTPASSSASPSLADDAGRLPFTVICPLPYNLAARPYNDKDEPWVWSLDRTSPDCRGNLFRGVRND